MLLVLDPGKEGLSPTLFRENEYLAGTVIRLTRGGLGAECRAAYRNVFEWINTVPGDSWPSEIVVEEMIYYPQSGSAKASSEIAALLHLQAIGAFVAGSFDVPVSYYPARVWKKQLPKEICHERIRKVLTPTELAALERDCAQHGKKAHNLMDSAGIGLFHLGRFRP